MSNKSNIPKLNEIDSLANKAIELIEKVKHSSGCENGLIEGEDENGYSRFYRCEECEELGLFNTEQDF